MLIHQETVEVRTTGQGLQDITRLVAQVVERSRVKTGLCHVFIQHTSASLVIQENADPSVQHDLQSFLSDLVPEQRAWVHTEEGPDDMPAHVKAALTKTSELIPVGGGRLLLGTWQGLYVWEHRAQVHQRRLIVHVQGAE